MTVWICGGCGVEHPDTSHSPAPDCAVCARDGRRRRQVWTTLDELADRPHRVVATRLGENLLALHRIPAFAFGQWSYLVATGAGNLLWDPPNAVTDELVDLLVEGNGVAAIAASGPRMFASQVSWSHIFGAVPVFVHESERQWVQRRNPVITLWRDVAQVLPGVAVIHCGPGGAVAHFGRTLLGGDTVRPVGHGSVTFSSGGPAPLSAKDAELALARIEPYEFDELYGARGTSIRADAKNAVLRAAASGFARRSR